MADYFVLNHTSLKRYNTLRLDVTAHTLILPHSIEAMVEALKDYKGKRMVRTHYSLKIIMMKIPCLSLLN